MFKRKIFREKILTNEIVIFILLIECFVLSFADGVKSETDLNQNDMIKLNHKGFKSVPTTVKTYENDTVLLPCYHSSPYKYVRWHKDDILLVDSRYPEIPTPERIHLWTNGSLQVSRVKSEDTGEYYCEIMVNGGHAVQIHAIEVQYPPTIISQPNGVVEIPIGSVFEIICEAKGIPHPVITWKRKGIDIQRTEIPENKRRLLVEVENKEMSGPIECIATNGVGEPAVAGIHLNVLFEPEVKATSNTVHTKINLRTHLECLVTSAPAATVHWFHHGVPVIPDLRISRHDSEIQSNSTIIHYFTESKHKLIIKKVKDHDLGMYECRAENKIGFKKVIIELTGRPLACTFKTSPMAATSTTHNLIWQTESLSPLIEYKLKFRQIPSGNLTPQNRQINVSWNELIIPAELSEGSSIHTAGYTLRGLQPASVYEAIVLSRNRYGWSDNSNIVRFATGGEVQLPNYSTEPEIHYDEIQDNILTDISPPDILEQNSNDIQNNGIQINCNIFVMILMIIAQKLFNYL